MKSIHQQELLAACHMWSPQTQPETQDEALGRIAGLFRLALGEARLLFYLIALPPELNPLKLVPCPARLLSTGIFVHDASACNGYFTFETESFYYLPLTLKAYNFGYLFLESPHCPLEQPAQLLAASLANKVASTLNGLGCPGIAQVCPPDPLVSLKFEPDQALVWIAGEHLYVSDNELNFLKLLDRYHKQGRPCPRALLCQVIYKDEGVLLPQRENRLDSLVTRLRRKLKQLPRQPVDIETVRGTGYQLRFIQNSD